MIRPDTARSLAAFRDLLAENSAAAGLTSVRGPDEISRRHIGESLLLLEALDNAGAVRSPVIDIGSGGGVPGIPIKIARPHLVLTLLEATKKKAAFLELAVEQLALADVSIVNARAEDAARDVAHRETYALALARAVAPLPVLLELALPFLQIGGVLATPKGSKAEDEVSAATNALAECGGEIIDVRPLRLPWEGPSPLLVLVRKVRHTPGKYPRRAGIPSKRPL